MIDYTQVREKIETLLDTSLSVHIVFENTEQTEHNIEHIEVFDSDSRKEPMDMSSSVSLVHGLLTVSIFTLAGVGTQRAREIATIIDGILINKAISGLSFSDGELYSVGRVKGDFLYQHNFVVQYQYFYGQDDSNTC